jgi:hypothetical protein
MIDLEYDGTDFQLININNRIRLLGRLAAQAATSSTTEGTVLTLTIPANALGANGAIRIR